MSAATATRRPYPGSSGGGGLPGMGSTTTTQTQPSHSAAAYPTPTSISSASSAYRLGPSGGAVGAAGQRSGAGYPLPFQRTAGDSWSLQREGERHVIVIEDTPPPASSAGPSGSTRTGYPPPAIPQNLHASNPGNPAKRPKYTQSNSAASSTQHYQQQQQQQSYPYPPVPPNGYQVNHVQIAGPSNTTTFPDPVAQPVTTRKVSGAKRKHGELTDPATAVHLCFTCLLAGSQAENYIAYELRMTACTKHVRRLHLQCPVTIRMVITSLGQMTS